MTGLSECAMLLRWLLIRHQVVKARGLKTHDQSRSPAELTWRVLVTYVSPPPTFIAKQTADGLVFSCCTDLVERSSSAWPKFFVHLLSRR